MTLWLRQTNKTAPHGDLFPSFRFEISDTAEPDCGTVEWLGVDALGYSKRHSFIHTAAAACGMKTFTHRR